MNQTFFNQYKVLIIGFLMAIGSSAMELIDNGSNASPWIIGWSLFIAALTWAGRNLRGQWASISGIVLTTVIAFYNLHDSATGMNFKIFVHDLAFPLLSALVTVLWTSPAKSRAYESSRTIMTAKREAETSVPTMAAPKP